jgi:hypothetical protein
MSGAPPKHSPRYGRRHVRETATWRGAKAQRPLWASTATKDPAYCDVEYLEQLALRGTILTVPAATLSAFADHGDLAPARPLGLESERVLDAFGAAGMTELSAELEREGVEAFRTSYAAALEHIAARVEALRGGSAPRRKTATRHDANQPCVTSLSAGGRLNSSSGLGTW